MMNKAYFYIFLTLLPACSRNYGGHSPIPSPGGDFIVDVVSESQAANDPDPIWQHISLRPMNIQKPILPGNVFQCSCYSKPDIVWRDGKNVDIVITGMVGQEFKNSPPPKTKIVKGITFSFLIKSTVPNDP